MFTSTDHTWVICAYRESPYLAACIKSLKAQTVQSSILMVTSTPCQYISTFASIYNIPLYVNPGEGGIGPDWNFGLSMAKTPLITIAHQDDIYESTYTEELLLSLSKAKSPIMYFTDYGELREEHRVTENRLLRIKRLMLLPVRLFPGWKFARRLSLSCGNPICCPSVTYMKEVMRDSPFGTRFKSNLDWEQAEHLSRRKGRFIYNRKILMFHRIHEASATSALIADQQRTREDFEMMSQFWPKWLARRLSGAYQAAQHSNGFTQT